MAKPTPLDRQWAYLMSLCESESKFLSEGEHPRLLRLVQAEIDELARAMGFSDRCIASRDFRAERDGDRIVQIIRG